MSNPVQGMFDFYYIYGNLLRRQQAGLAEGAPVLADSSADGEMSEAARAYSSFLNNFREAPAPAEPAPAVGGD